MSTVVVVKKQGVVAIAADTLTTFGARKVSANYNRQPQKIFRAGESLVGMTGWAVSQQVLEHALANLEESPSLATPRQIFEVFLEMHARLKREYFLVPQNADPDGFESSHISALIANRHGIFGVCDSREVYEYERFWASGSGSDYALGAMHAIYDLGGDATAIAEAGVRAGIEFDDGSGAPIESHAVRLAPAAEELTLLLKV
jgi:ATP-dependent HslUV protease, peptidase subunit HslV